MMKRTRHELKSGFGKGTCTLSLVLLAAMLLAVPVMAADVILNGDFATDLSDWTHIPNGSGSVAHDTAVFGNAPGSIRNLTDTGRRVNYDPIDEQAIATVITDTDDVWLSLYWYKYSTTVAADWINISIQIVRPDLTVATLWSDTSVPAVNSSLSATVAPIDVSGDFNQTGNYTIRIVGDLRTGRDTGASAQFNIDDLVLDVQGAANNAPTVVAGATAVSVSPVNRFGSNTTTISTSFTDIDQPGVGAFTVSFKIREPDNTTELILVNAQNNGGGGLTITDDGGGDYTASYVYDPADAQTTGLYDLYFEVFDGTDAAVDDYPGNLDELEINEVLPNNAPTVVAGATAVSVSPVNRFGSNTTTISTSFTDIDQPGVGAFTVSFKIREPDNTTELILVNAQNNGGGGLTITDDGGGDYTASYVYDPDDAQATGLYDLYFEVFDGTDSAVDDYPGNLDELEINEVLPNNAPTVVAGATAVSVSPVNRFGSNATTISTTFTDSDQPGVGAFTVSFKIREPDNTTELILVNAQNNGGGGLTITDDGGGDYTASYVYDPDDAQATGLYDLYFEVFDGTDSVLDDYTSNLDELEIITPPTVVTGATAVSVSPVNRFGSNTTTISTSFTDIDQPGVGVFTVSFKIREPDNTTELILVNAQNNGGGGLTITDDGGGDYTASYVYDPDDAQTPGLYDLYFEVSDGSGTAVDDYPGNLDELEITDTPPNNVPTVVASATVVSVSPVNRIDSNTTTISTSFTDSDQPGVGAFTVSFKIREPDNTTELILVNAQNNGGGGLTITDDGGGDYTASYVYDPADAQTTGLYDLYFEVFDGIDSAVDDYTNNPDELEIVTPPTVTAGATAVSISPVYRVGSNTTTISTSFTDIDQPGVGAFTVSFKIREPDNTTELILVNAQNNGGGGLTITDDGGGDYTASYVYDPDDAQTPGLYDLYFEVSDGLGTAVDNYLGNLDELEISATPPNNVPTVVAGATAVSVSPVNRFGSNTTTISTSFTDIDQPGVGAFTVSFKIREPDNTTELILVNAQNNGGGGLTITDDGGGDYTASYVYDPDDAQTTGLYDLYFEVFDGTDSAVDDYTSNLDELEINEVLPNNAPAVVAGATAVSVSPVNRFGSNTTTISTTFTDSDQPGVGAFTVSFKIREPDNTTELILVNAQNNGGGGLTITDDGGGDYTASYVYDPADAQTTGLYDLYFEVFDGTDSAVDDYTGNLDELEINEVLPNNPPDITAGATSVNPPSLDRFGAITTELSVTFSDADVPGVGAFRVTFQVREPFGAVTYVVADALLAGEGGMTISDDTGGVYTARFNWDPDDNIILGYYDIYSLVSDGSLQGEDQFENNPDELLITNGGENSPPVAPSDNVFASPAGIERIGTNSTTISATFVDADSPGVGAFTVSFKLRLPDDTAELVLASGLGHGAGGVTIVDDGGGVYTAAISWDPPDGQTLGVYDLYFQVSDGFAISTDGYMNNLDELEIYDAISNSGPTLIAGNTTALPASITRIGSEYTMIRAFFSDTDLPGRGAFTVTVKVRDPGSTEYPLASGVRDGEQGLRIRHVTGDEYEAALLWDPPVGQITGTYDLYFQVTDDDLASVTDDYTANSDELTVSAVVPAGDGHLLRRNNDAGNCGGPSSACHNIADHQEQDCLVCHTPHSTTNIYLVRETIQTPNSGEMPVSFKTLGIGDPYNDPDPSAGDPNSGVMADDTDGVFTGVCEVCHTTSPGGTSHHTNDGSHGPPPHHNAEDCTACHPHSEGFAVSGGGESSGGQSCGCHNSIFTPMNSSTSTYHHVVNGTGADYTISSKTCLMCHVDHDIFRPDLNTGIGTRARNLRVDITTPVVLGSSSVLADFDYQSSGTGGICLSCHTSAQVKGYTQPDGTTQTPAISKSDYDAATSSHNYTAPSTFTTDGSTFNANCVKCHNDNRTRSYQNSTDKFAAHDSDYRRILAPLDAASPADPLEETFCFQCHSTSSNPNAGSNLDNYGVKAMSDASLGVEAAFSRTYSHPTATYSGRHKPIESAGDLGDGATRHAECADCHNPHGAQQGTHDGTSTLVSNALKGTWGVEPAIWPAKPNPSDNAVLFAVPASYTRVEPAQKGYQICLKCHSNYTTLPAGSRNLAAEINHNYDSMHGITQAGTNSYCNSTTMFEPWGTNKIAWCSDCHRSSTSTDPLGPHGSNMEHLLVATIVSDDTNGTPLCLVCHQTNVYWDGSGANSSKFPDHPAAQGAHQEPEGCFACHMWEFATRTDLGINSTASLANGTISVHGMNKRFVNNEQDGGGAGLGQYSDAFVDGYIEDMDFTNRKCWSGTCKTHSNKAY